VRLGVLAIDLAHNRPSQASSRPKRGLQSGRVIHRLNSDRFHRAAGRGLVLVGIVVGVGLALGLTRVISALLFGVTPTDPPTFLIVAVALALVACVACYIPARRATKLDPLVSLRYE
jgi:Mg/Co/Ni transporter MgtE